MVLYITVLSEAFKTEIATPPQPSPPVSESVNKYCAGSTPMQFIVGKWDGEGEGTWVGGTVGREVGYKVGRGVGSEVGVEVGVCVGIRVGREEGLGEGV